ncbi:MAG: exodeoxyribonuclease V subunit alpha [Solirubrobacterales bacterium]|nr:exodeoxyribonuclease V subunit alpha [Solirubrobacterales bacterium]
MSTLAGLEPFDARRATATAGLLRAFNDVGLLTSADVHVAQTIARLAGEDREAVKLAAALAARAPRLGHVFVDLATIAATASVDSEEPVDLSSLPWPAEQGWLEGLRDSPLVATGEEDPRVGRPLRLLETRLYLDRYWREERRVAADLGRLAREEPSGVVADVLDAGLGRLFGDTGDEAQRRAAAAAVCRRLAVVAGGPGTGKTTTVARIVALHAEQAQARGERPPLVALAAPTGKAAARLQEAVHDEAAQLDLAEPVRRLLLDLRASTLHRLLGWRPDSHSRFKHDRENRLPHALIIVDETSMVSLWLMARLVEAVRPDARLVLVGDPGQLSSIEAGVVLADIVGPAVGDAPVGRPLARGIVVLRRVYRYGGGIAQLADAIRRGEVTNTLDSLASAPDEVEWLAVDAAEQAPNSPDLQAMKRAATEGAAAMVHAARASAARDALRALGTFRLLCAHRRGPHGVASWTQVLQGWLAEELGELEFERPDYVGRPLLVTENDYELGLYNGDAGVVVRGPAGDRAEAVFERAGALLTFTPLRLGAVETVYAMTVHKSQGSQFDTAAILLPPPEAPLLTRELLYTAVTRARRRVILIGTPASVEAAVARPVARASGLRERLWANELSGA